MLTLLPDRTNIVKWWVYESHGVQHYCKGHTVETKSLGQVSTISASIKKKLNTIIYNKTELVAADDIVPHETWKSYFLDYKGYKLN